MNGRNLSSKELHNQTRSVRHAVFPRNIQEQFTSRQTCEVVTKARLQIAETLFFTCVIQIPTKRGACPRCNNPSETISRVLNGCMEFKNLYVAHNRTVKLIGKQIAADKIDSKIHCDTIANLEMFVNETKISAQFSSFQWVNHRRPDLLLVNKGKKESFHCRILSFL